MENVDTTYNRAAEQPAQGAVNIPDWMNQSVSQSPASVVQPSEGVVYKTPANMAQPQDIESGACKQQAYEKDTSMMSDVKEQLVDIKNSIFSEFSQLFRRSK